LKFAGRLRAFAAALLLLVTGTAAAASLPCKPFEGGRVETELLETMRAAAFEGRLFRVVPGASKIAFCVRHLFAREFRGEFTNVVGGLVVPSEEKKDSHALLLIHTTSMQASDPELKSLVQGRHFMDTDNYPDILFAGRTVDWYSPRRGTVSGDLTLHGVTRPLSIDIGIEVLEKTPDGKPERLFLEGHGQVNRYEFDMRSHRFIVNENVRLCLDVELVHWTP
jgi:polyisoprenoid-binding protein YceI